MKNKFYVIFSILFCIATLFMGVGYASINSISLNVFGEMTAQVQDGVFITDVKCINDDSYSELEKLTINSYKSTIIDSVVSLDNVDNSSSLKLEVTVYNSNSEDYVFVGTFFEDEFYDNKNIIFELEGVQIDDIVSKGEYLTFYVNFSYRQDGSSDISLNVLNSMIDYRFEPYSVKETLSGIEFNYLLKNSVYAPEGDVYEYYSVDANRAIDNTVKIIVFGDKKEYLSEVSDLNAEPIDLYQTGSISMYRRVLADGMYKIYILSESGKFILNENAAWMFDKLYSLEKIINLHLLDTSKVVNMRDMFCDCASIKTLDLSNFSTSNVTNMIGMFARMKEITYLDLSTFDTSNVIEIGQMFTNDSKLKKIYVSNKWDISKKVADADGVGLFTSCTNLTGGNGTVLGTDVTYKMAVVDGSTPGYLTSKYNLNTGINVNHVIKNKSASEIENWTLSTRFADTSVVSITFGKTRDYYHLVNDYNGVAVDGDSSGVISVYRVPNGSKWDVYILSNSGLFEANSDSAWLFDNLFLLERINNLKLLDTSKVSNFRDMFCDLQTITELDLSNFDTSSATSFEGMFARMYHMTTIDISTFSTKKITTILNMFSANIASTYTYSEYLNIVPYLKTVYVSSEWDVSSLASQVAFTNNVNLVGGNGTVFDAANITTEYAQADTATNVGYFTLK